MGAERLTIKDVREAFERGDFDYADCRTIKYWGGQYERAAARSHVVGRSVGDTMLMTGDRGQPPYLVSIEAFRRTKCSVFVLEDTPLWPAGTRLDAPMAMLEACDG